LARLFCCSHRTQKESAGIVRLRSKQKLSREAVRHLNESTDGWAAGLILMLESVRRGIEPSAKTGEIYKNLLRNVED
jgi:ATP/maltotriose-dependent transcriptional regulator MalT